jgi:dTDP-4-dehydrorhamnose reductase
MKKVFHKDLKFFNMLKNKKFLITGGSGMLANSFLRQIKKHTRNTKIYCLNKSKLDVTKKNSFKRYSNIKPDYIIHCAALVNADVCEKKRN